MWAGGTGGAAGLAGGAGASNSAMCEAVMAEGRDQELEGLEPEMRQQLEEAFCFFDREGDGQIEAKVLLLLLLSCSCSSHAPAHLLLLLFQIKHYVSGVEQCAEFPWSKV